MIEERIYKKSELHHGKCTWCNEVSDEITKEGICVDCIEDELFYQNSMKGI